MHTKQNKNTKISKTTNLLFALTIISFGLFHSSMAGTKPPLETKLHWGLSASGIGHSNNSISYTSPLHSGLWVRMCQQFKINYPKTDPRIQKHIQHIIRSPNYLKDLKSNGEPYLYHIVEALEKRGLPIEMALLPMIESKFDPHTTSRAGAEGLWQIMPTTGKVLGLKQDSWFQGTRDLDASTTGALNHLYYLGELFQGDWLLVLAAYNSGENRVLRAIKKNQAAKKSTRFWDLELPKETKEYVPKFLALISIIKDPKKYNIALPLIPNKPYFTHIKLNRSIKLSDAADLVGVNEKELKRLNAGLRKATTHPNGPFKVLVPYTEANNFEELMENNNADLDSDSLEEESEAVS